MLILFQLLLVSVLVLISITLFIDESRHRERTRHLIRIHSYREGLNRRRVIRHPAEMDVQYTLKRGLKLSKSKDISTHGLGLLLDEKLTRRTVMNINIKVDDTGEPVRASAKVMWTKEVPSEYQDGKRYFHTGIKFVRFADQRQKRRLFDCIRQIESV